MSRSIIARQTILVTLAGLIPIPFLDTWFQAHLRATMVRYLAHEHRVELDEAVVKTLTRAPMNLILGCLLGVVWWPIRRLIRKLIYVLTVKDAVDASSDTFIRGLMVQEALVRGRLPHDAAQIRAAMDDATSRHTRSPLWGPRSPQPGRLRRDGDPHLVRLLARTADRGGGAAALAHFRQLLDSPAMLDALTTA